MITDDNSIGLIDTIKREAVRSAGWSLLGNLVPRLTSPILMVFLAKLLTPSDYGLVEIATITLTLVGLIQQAGLAQAIIQREDRLEEVASVAFWLNLVISIVLYLVLFLLAPLVGGIYSESRVIAILQVLSFQLVISSLSTVQVALLTRRFQFKKIFWVQMGTAIAPFLVSIPLAQSGAGYWALVFGSLAGSSINTLITWYQVKWRPLFIFDFSIAKQLLGFGWFILLESLLGWLLVYFDNAVVGKVLGAEELGIYALGFNLSLMIISLPLSSISGITLPLFSRLQYDRKELSKAYLDGMRIVAAYAIPAGIGLSLISKPAVRIVFGERWEGLGMVLSILALYSGFGHLWILNSDAFRAIGRPDITPKLYMFIVPIMIIIFLISAPYGLIVFSLARSSVVLVSAPLHTKVAVKYIGLPRTYLWNITRYPLMASIIMIFVILFLRYWFISMSDLLNVILSVVIGSLVYLVTLWFFDKRIGYLIKFSLATRN